MLHIRLERTNLTIVGYKDASLGVVLVGRIAVDGIDAWRLCHTHRSRYQHAVVATHLSLLRHGHHNIGSAERHVASLIVVGRIPAIVRHTDEIWHVSLNLLCRDEAIFCQLPQPERLSAIYAKRSQQAILLVGDGLHRKWQHDGFPTAADAHLCSLPVVMRVADAVGRKLLRAVEVVVALLHIRQHNVLCRTVHHHIRHRRRSQRSLVHIQQQVGVSYLSINAVRNHGIACLDAGKRRTVVKHISHRSNIGRIETTDI